MGFLGQKNCIHVVAFSLLGKRAFGVTHLGRKKVEGNLNMDSSRHTAL